MTLQSRRQELVDGIREALADLHEGAGAGVGHPCPGCAAQTLLDDLDAILKAAETVVCEWNESNPFVGYSVEALSCNLFSTTKAAGAK